MSRVKKQRQEQDLSSFMSILLMTIGCLVLLLVANTVIIVSNPENVRITTVVTDSLYINAEGEDESAPPLFANTVKEPLYIDVHKDHLQLYQPPETKGGENLPILVPLKDLELTDNALERFLSRVEQRKHKEYIVLLVRPYAASVFVRLRKVIANRGIDVGHELYDENERVIYDPVFLQE